MHISISDSGHMCTVFPPATRVRSVFWHYAFPAVMDSTLNLQAKRHPFFFALLLPVAFIQLLEK